MVIPKQSEVSKVSVLIVNDRIENQHAAHLLIKIFAKRLVIVQTFLQGRFLQDSADGNKRGIFVSKKPALGR